MSETQRLKGNEKLLVDMGPLAAMFVGYFFGKPIAPTLDRLFGLEFFTQEGNALFVAVALFLPAFAIAFAYSVWKEKRVAPMLMVTAVIVTVLGVMTLVLKDKTFTYIKPTISYLMFALVLGGGQLAGRNFLKTLFDGALQLPDMAWKTLTWRFVGFFIFTALLNEILWRSLTGDCIAGEACSGETTWFNIKIFGFTGLYIVFMLSQAPYIAKHMQETSSKDQEETKSSLKAELKAESDENSSKDPHNPS